MTAGRSKSGFTLIEMCAVLVLTALLMTAAFYSASSPRGKVDLDSALARLEKLDRMARLEAKRNGQARLHLDVDANRLEVTAVAKDERVLTSCPLPSGIVLKLPRSNVEEVREEQRVDYHGNGCSPTYGVEIADGTLVKWILIAGDSGQVTLFDKRESLDAVLRATADKTRSHTR